MSTDTPASLYANKRASLVLALGLLGHKNAGELIDRAQRTADAIARCEMEGSLPLAEDDNEGQKLREHLPMLWDFVIAGHVGGGWSGPTPEPLTDAQRARMIAAAPELMAALIDMQRAAGDYEATQGGPSSQAMINAAKVKAARAIAKAEGRA